MIIRWCTPPSSTERNPSQPALPNQQIRTWETHTHRCRPPSTAPSATSQFPCEPFHGVRHLQIPEAAESPAQTHPVNSGPLPKMSAQSDGWGGLLRAEHREHNWEHDGPMARSSRADDDSPADTAATQVLRDCRARAWPRSQNDPRPTSTRLAHLSARRLYRMIHVVLRCPFRHPLRSFNQRRICVRRPHRSRRCRPGDRTAPFDHRAIGSKGAAESWKGPKLGRKCPLTPELMRPNLGLFCMRTPPLSIF